MAEKMKAGMLETIAEIEATDREDSR